MRRSFPAHCSVWQDVSNAKMTAEITGASAEVGLTPQLSEEDMNTLANEGLRKNVSPGMVRRLRIRRLTVSLKS